ncbi:MAG: twin-arginine translocase TatA/TatE family subunit [Acidobacteriota bacterium]
MFGPLGVPELLFIFGLALLVFGPRKLPEVGRALGRGMAELRKASNDLRRTINTELIDDEIRQANPANLVRDSLRDVKEGLDRAVRGEDDPPAETSRDEASKVEGAVARSKPTASAPGDSTPGDSTPDDSTATDDRR